MISMTFSKAESRNALFQLFLTYFGKRETFHADSFQFFWIPTLRYAKYRNIDVTVEYFDDKHGLLNMHEKSSMYQLVFIRTLNENKF